MSILGFSIVGNPKVTFIFILGFPNPRKSEVYIIQQYSIINTLGQGKDFFPLIKKGLE